MPNSLFLHPSNPNLFELYGIIVAVLLAAFLMNALYEWLKTKPWKKKEIEDPDLLHHNSHHPGV